VKRGRFQGTHFGVEKEGNRDCLRFQAGDGISSQDEGVERARGSVRGGKEEGNLLSTFGVVPAEITGADQREPSQRGEVDGTRSSAEHDI